MKVYLFSNGVFSRVLRFDSAEQALGYAAGYRDAAEACCTNIAAYAESEREMMEWNESAPEVQRALTEK